MSTRPGAHAARVAALALTRVYPLEWATLAAGSSWAIRLWTVGPAVYAGNPALSIMARAPAGVWALLFTLLWAWLAVAVVRRDAMMRARAGLAHGLVWAWLAILIHAAAPDAPGDGTYAGLALGLALGYLLRRWELEARG